MRLAELFSIFPFGARNGRSIRDAGISESDIVVKKGQEVLKQRIKIIGPDGTETPYSEGTKVSEIMGSGNTKI